MSMKSKRFERSQNSLLNIVGGDWVNNHGWCWFLFCFFGVCLLWFSLWRAMRSRWSSAEPHTAGMHCASKGRRVFAQARKRWRLLTKSMEDIPKETRETHWMSKRGEKGGRGDQILAPNPSLGFSERGGDGQRKGPSSPPSLFRSRFPSLVCTFPANH